MNHIGFACKLIAVPGTATQSCTLKNANNARLRDLGIRNLQALEESIAYCKKTGIGLFRISSDILPFASHPAINFDWQNSLAAPLAHAGEVIREAGLRVSMHPGQYTVLNSPHEEVVERAVLDLCYHADFLDALGLDASHKLILHVGGVYGERAQAMERFVACFHRLPANVQCRLTLENDEKSFAIDDVLTLCAATGIPAIFDVFHHAINPAPEGSWVDWLDASAATWKAEDGRQKIHYSEQRVNEKPGAHSQTIGVASFLEFYHALAGREPDIMLEVKDKNISAVKCVHLLQAEQVAKGALEAEWARYKYAVLEHSHAHYLKIRQQISGAEQLAPVVFYTLCEEALQLPVLPSGAVNAAQHVWGYFKRKASLAEKKKYEELITELAQDISLLPKVKVFLLRLTERHQEDYLLRSYYFA